MFFRNFLSGTLASWRALTPMDRNNLVLNVPPKMIGMFVAGYGISAYANSREQPQRTSAEKSSVEPDHPSKATGQQQPPPPGHGGKFPTVSKHALYSRRI
jgi:hypothetical protein